MSTTTCRPTPAPAEACADLDAEACVLGSIVLDKEVLGPVRRIVTADSFYSPAHQTIFNALIALSGQGTPIDAVTLHDELLKRDSLTRVGGPDYIRQLFELVPSPANAEHYARIVQEQALKRRMLEGLDRAKARLLHPAGDEAATILAETLDRLQALTLAPERAQRGSSALVTPFSMIAPLSVEWIWQGRIPVGMLSLVIGDGGLGKGTALCDVATRLTTGRPMPDGSGGGNPRSVLWMTAEDDPARVLGPRLAVAGANLERVNWYRVRERDGGEREMVMSPEDLALLERVIVEHQAVLVVIDPISAYLPASIDERGDAELRRVLSPLSKLCERTGAAIVGIKHTNKDHSRGALQRISGSVAWGNAARSVIAVGLDPNDQAEDEREKRRVLAVVKLNVGLPAPSLAFRLASREGEAQARVEWLGASDVDARDVLGPPVDADERMDRAGAIEFLRERLEAGVEVLSKQIEQEALRRGIKPRTLARARKMLGVKSRRPEGPGTPWVMSLPVETPTGTLAPGTLGEMTSGGHQDALPRNNATTSGGILGENAPGNAENPIPSNNATVKDANRLSGAEPDFPEAWGVGDEVPCERCGSGTKYRDAEGRPRHPAALCVTR